MSPENALNTDLYEVLGVAADATPAEITSAYRALARKLHPDVNVDADDGERFKDVTAAYDVLGDADKRAEYDEFRSMVGSGFAGNAHDGWGQAGHSAAHGPDAGSFGSGDLADLLGSLFGSRDDPGFGDRPHRGADAVARVPISFTDAVMGSTITLSGAGDRRIPVTIPAGVDTGDLLRVPGAGGPGSNGGPAGDLLVEVVVGSHPRFTRDGLDLRTSATVPFATAALGGRTRVGTLDDAVTIKVPEGTQPGRVMRVRGRGIAAENRKGDLLVTIDVAVPTKLSDDQRAAVEALRDALETQER
jgi:molecular chaperone DnaJ